MYSNSVKEYTRFVAERIAERYGIYLELDEEEIDRIMWSWGLSAL